MLTQNFISHGHPEYSNLTKNFEAMLPVCSSSLPTSSGTNVRKRMVSYKRILPKTPDKTNFLYNKTVQERNVISNCAKAINSPLTDVTHQCSFQFTVPDQLRQNFENISEFSSASSKSSTSAKKNNKSVVAKSTSKNVASQEKKSTEVRRHLLINYLIVGDLETERQKEKSAFFDKLAQELTVKEYDQLIDILGHNDHNNEAFLELFKNVQSILYPNYKELYEEFFLFLRDIHAHNVIPYLMIKNMNRFKTKLQVYFKEQPTQVKRIFQCLTNLSENSEETIKTALLPFFRENKTLAGGLLPIFSCENQPEVVTAGSKQLNGQEAASNIHKENNPDVNGLVVDTATAERDKRKLSEIEEKLTEIKQEVTDPETLTPNDLEIQREKEESLLGALFDKLRQTLNVEDYDKLIDILALYDPNYGEFLELFKNVQSVLYPKYEKLYEEFFLFLTDIQAHKVGKHTPYFLVKDLDGFIKKLVVYLKDQPIPMKMILKELANGLGESFETVTIKTEPSEEFDVSKELGTELDDNICASGVENCDESESDKGKRKIQTSEHSSPKKVKVAPTVKKNTEHKPGSSPGQQKRLAEEPKVEYPEPAECVDLKLHTEEMIKCEEEFFESSQEITNFSLSTSTKIEDQDVPWSIEEDKLMVQVFRQICENEENFKHMAEMLQNRSIPAIKNRFNTLMLLLEQMTATQRLQSAELTH